MSILLKLESLPKEQADRFAHWSDNIWRLGFLSIGFLAVYLFILSFFTPSFRELEDPSSSLASEIYSAEGQVIGRYFVENRVRIDYDRLSPNLVKALIATEDVRYTEHAGIDGRAMGRVLFGVLTLSPKGGGSTISQQLAKLLYSDRNFTGMGKIRKVLALANRKFSEWITAVKLERRYTKQEIIAMYFNQVDYVNGASGIKAASEIYFDRKPDSLNVLESATLVGMLQNPSYYNPRRRPERCKSRRNVVLMQMVKNNVLTQKEYQRIKDKPIELRFSPQNHTEGNAPYFRSELGEEIKKILAAADQKRPDGQPYNLYKDGLKIYTTIDADMQQMAEEAMVEHMKPLQARFFQVWKGKDPWTYKSADDTPEDIARRQKSLTRLMRESERYEVMRSAALDDMLRNYKEDHGLELTDNDLDLLLAEGRKSGAISEAVKNGSISRQRSQQLGNVLSDDTWPDLRTKYQTFQVQAKRIFDTKVKMRVFAYNSERGKDTLMSPLDSLRYHRMMMQIGSVAVEPGTGHVKAWVGGVNFKYFQYDHVRTYRQVGSTFKPFVYATAIAQQGISPCSQVLDVPTTIQSGEADFKLSRAWTPKNAGGYSGRNYTLFEGLRESVNTVSVYLLKQLGSTESVRGMVNNMGLDSSVVFPNGEPMLTRQPSLCLGASDLKVIDMTGAYATFANNGTYVKPVYLLRIEDKNGKVLYEHTPEEENAIPPTANYVMVQMLKYVAKGAPGIASLKSEVGGKTGTTNKHVDGWYMGITPGLVVGTWVGGDDKWIRFLSIGDGQGARMARPFFAAFMRRVEANPASCSYDINKRFIKPDGDIGITIDCQSFNQAVEGATLDASDFDADPFAEPPAKTPADTSKAPKPAAKPKADAGF